MLTRSLCPISLHRSGGFTLIELLVVIIIIAILAAIAIPVYLGARMKAQDSATYTLVRNGLTVVESAYVDAQDYTQITAGALQDIEPSITWLVVANDLVDPAVPLISNVTARASRHEVNYYAQSAARFDIASQSDSDNLYGIEVLTSGLAGASYLKVRAIEGDTSTGW